jgi:hypothetical protein
MVWPAIIGAAGAVGGALIGNKGSKKTTTQQAPAWWQEPAKGIAGRVDDLQSQDVWAGPGQNWYDGLNRGQNVASRWGQGFEGFTPQDLWLGSQRNVQNTMAGDWLNQNPHLQGAIGAAQRPVVEQFQEQIMPQLRSQAQTAGAFGGARQGLTEAQAARDTQRVLGEISSTMTAQDYGRERALMEAANRFAPELGASMMGAQLMGPQTQMQLALQNQLQRQSRMDAPVGRQADLAAILAALQPGHTATTTQGGGALGAIQGALGGGQLATSIAGLFGNKGGGSTVPPFGPPSAFGGYQGYGS